MHIFYTPNSRQEKEPPGGGPFPVINQRKGVRGYGTPGAGDGNWTHVPSLEGWCTSRCTTPADRRGQLLYHVGSCISSRTTDKAHPIYAITDFLCSIDLVQVGGLEPPRYEPQEPKSWVSANSTIPACWMVSPELHWCRETSYENNTSPTEPLPKGRRYPPRMWDLVPLYFLQKGMYMN